MILRLFKSSVLLGILAVLMACTNSDDYLFDSQDSQQIEVSAVVTRSFDSDGQKSKADTIQPGDSLIFLTSVSPSKSIRNRQYFWTMDGANFASEYSFKKSINEPGIHKIAFIFVDFFGDTLSDTLTVTVASPPIMDTEKFIPARGTQNIDPDSAIRFAWNFDDPDSLWDVSFRFILQDSEKDTLVDTLLNQANFTCRKKLSPLLKYTWTVSAYNEFGQRSKESLSTYFFTDGKTGQNAIAGTVGIHSDQTHYNYNVSLQDSSQAPLTSLQLFGNPGASFNISPLDKGTYSLIVSVDSADDFKPDTIRFKLSADQVLELDSIILQDKIPPRIQSLNGSDTLDYSDTLYFIVYDYGGPISTSKINIYFEGEYVPNFTLLNDTLHVPFNKKSANQNWASKMIFVEAIDQSNNKVWKTFYLRPNASLAEVFSD
ncbi:hypothetical protein SAMN05720473_10244 [Fibrobacter sp. UWB15]|jgi:hypothetical protein|uniref:hypothetical protein n=1 Tax=unclassified Fibrobacter TaxID=2634177 RepID=UPI000911C762|nr:MULTISPECIES: hypothetical protein [unclassified Fibrobacter]PWJ66309.1 hypothetical protein BGW99_10244 [Fibrobacter sp. UWB6]SHG35755.1 hypothetical protein SAMN05720760_10944 [Fibrobacter sp. UWB8]SMG19873.1 hypothetical protein SAMN05720473_10244 [Fibrobacter sp. UWB15]